MGLAHFGINSADESSTSYSSGFVRRWRLLLYGRPDLWWQRTEPDLRYLRGGLFFWQHALQKLVAQPA